MSVEFIGVNWSDYNHEITEDNLRLEKMNQKQQEAIKSLEYEIQQLKEQLATEMACVDKIERMNFMGGHCVLIDIARETQSKRK